MASGPGYVFVRYFATGETGRLRAADAAPFRAGLAAGRHTAKVSRSAHAAFARALDEAAAYLQVCHTNATPGPAPAPDQRNTRMHMICPVCTCEGLDTRFAQAR